MKNNHSVSILLLFLMISGCASYLHERDSKKWDKNLILRKQPPLCEINPTLFSIFGENKEAVFSFDNLLKKNSDMHHLSLVEASVLWALLQFKVRPDLVNPKSRLQIFYVKDNKPYYHDFSSYQEETTSFLFGLDVFLKENNSRYNVLSISKFLSSISIEQIPIGEGFSEFVQANKSKLKSDPILYKNYFKAGLEIRKGESLPDLNFNKIISDFYTVKESDQYKRNRLLFTENRKGSDYKCNFDINLYRKGIYLISNDPDPKSWTVGISKANGDHIFMVAGNSIKEIKPLKDTFFLKPDKIPATPMKFCFLSGENIKISIVSTFGRDPAQHLFHIMNYDILESESLQEVREYINFPRHLFLQNPSRLLYESEKGSPEQLASFLTLDFPLYHKQQLGLVFGYAKLNQETSFILDHRGNGALNCQKK